MAVFTNLTPEHLDYHRDIEDYFQVKARLFTEFSPATSVVNVDDQYGELIAAMCTGRLITVQVCEMTQPPSGKPLSVSFTARAVSGTCFHRPTLRFVCFVRRRVASHI